MEKYKFKIMKYKALINIEIEEDVYDDNQQELNVICQQI